jgi:hypothetical protein
MTKEERERRDEFLRSSQWRELRYIVIRRDGARCAACGRTPQRDGICVHVDHIKPISLHWELRANPDNLQVLCADCNVGKSNKFSDSWNPSAPKNGEFPLTEEMLKSISSENAIAITKEQASVLMVNWPLVSGWPERIVGTMITKPQLDRCIEIRRLKNERRSKRIESRRLLSVPLSVLR